MVEFASVKWLRGSWSLVWKRWKWAISWNSRSLISKSGLYETLSTSSAHAAIPSCFSHHQLLIFLFFFISPWGGVWFFRGYVGVSPWITYLPFSLLRHWLPFWDTYLLSLPAIILASYFKHLHIKLSLCYLEYYHSSPFSLVFDLRSCISVFSHN